MYKQLCILLFIISICACNPKRGTDDLYNKVDNWAELMANSVMSKYDSLINYNNSEEKWQFDNAMLGQAIDKMGNKDQKYSQYLTDFVDYFILDDGSVVRYNQNEYFLDNINPAKNIITLYKRTGEEKYYKVIHTFLDQLKKQPRNQSGGFWHKTSYPNQMWLSGIYMYAPFIAQYAKEFNANELFNEATEQLILMYNQTIDTTTGLLYHAWDEDMKQPWCNSETGHSRYFWGRGMGWYMMTLVDVLEYLPENHKDRETLVGLLNNLSETLLNYQDKQNKLWYQIINMGNEEGNYLEASCSSMFTYSFAKGANRGFLPKKYFGIANETFTAILNEFIVFENEHEISMINICDDLGLGGSPYRDGSYEFYVGVNKTNNDPKGVAPFILAAIELKR